MVYVEVFMLDNILMNSLILMLTTAFLRARVRWWRLFLGSLFGAVYALFSLVAPLLGGVLKLAASLAIVAIVLLPCPWRGFLKALLAFYAATFITGGLVFAVLMLEGEGGVYMTMPLRAAVAGAILAMGLPRLARAWLYNKSGASVRVRMCMGGKTSEFIALVDSGNSLVEPLSGLPVIVAYTDEKYACEGARIVPYTDITGNGFLQVNKPHKLELLIDNTWREVNAYVGFAKAPLGRDFNALVGKGALNGLGKLQI